MDKSTPVVLKYVDTGASITDGGDKRAPQIKKLQWDNQDAVLVAYCDRTEFIAPVMIIEVFSGCAISRSSHFVLSANTKKVFEKVQYNLISSLRISTVLVRKGDVSHFIKKFQYNKLDNLNLFGFENKLLLTSLRNQTMI